MKGLEWIGVEWSDGHLVAVVWR